MISDPRSGPAQQMLPPQEHRRVQKTQITGPHVTKSTSAWQELLNKECVKTHTYTEREKESTGNRCPAILSY